MAEIVESTKTMHEIPTMGKVNAALTTGIIGTSLSGLMALGALGIGKGLIGNGWGWNNGPGNWRGGFDAPYGPHYGRINDIDRTEILGNVYNERKEQADYVELTKQYYEGQLKTQHDLNRDFFGLYKNHVDDAWKLYASQSRADFGLYKNQVDNSFALYKNQRDQGDFLMSKIGDVERKLDVMAAVRPYQDALINAKIDNVALIGDFNLARRTCKMIQGELVLPSTPTVTGYPSFSCCNQQVATGA